MKKNIVIGVLVVINLLTFVFVFIQKQEASETRAMYEKVLMDAVNQQEDAKAMIHRANEQARIAQIAAERQAKLAQQKAEKAKELAAER